VATLRFSRRAEADLPSISEYTLRIWGKAQTARYLAELEAFCQALASNPALGRACDNVRPGSRRMEHGRHVVFYRQKIAGVLVVRILHQSMLPDRHDTADPSGEL
jgi:toxin ParE1/3/4